MKTLYLVCGVPGSGKTWVCERLTEHFNYLPHDDYKDGDLIVEAATKLAADCDARPLLTECPFGERVLRLKLATAGFNVIPVFIVETPEVVIARYYRREGRTPAQATITRAKSIVERAIEWGCNYGRSENILKHLLKEVGVEQSETKGAAGTSQESAGSGKAGEAREESLTGAPCAAP